MDQPTVVLMSLLVVLSCPTQATERISPDQLLTSDASPSMHSSSRHGLQSDTYLPPGFWTESINKRPARKPTKAERNPAELMEMMEKGGKWDPRFMRLSRRDRKSLGKLNVRSHLGKKKFARPSVRSLWRAARQQKKPRRWSHQTAHEASELLFSLANCSTTEQWVTLDRLFWPRQLLFTKCASGGIDTDHVGGHQQTCGWPPGKLACRNVPLNVIILRWICLPKTQDIMNARIRRTNGTHTSTNPIDKKFYCKWFPVPYTITKDCECGLPKNSHEDF
ncbi:uncharacterized protein LOC132197253 [Neocloeon triangulifer]|uniref:uncharacterized protein LOC132197253 n=1 Tax=Neocloeon triangulifer TaxID=2078957 RepID=UPI00286F6574|nr:uncharacterized protein LOC132197253 [Neocloeon triangulifer]